MKNIIVSPWNETDVKNDITATNLSELMPQQFLVVKPQATTSMYTAPSLCSDESYRLVFEQNERWYSLSSLNVHNEVFLHGNQLSESL